MAGLPEVFGEVVMNGFVFQILLRDLSGSWVCLSIISRALSATTIMYSNTIPAGMDWRRIIYCWQNANSSLCKT
jgi:hypothetical protein